MQAGLNLRQKNSCWEALLRLKSAIETDKKKMPELGVPLEEAVAALRAVDFTSKGCRFLKGWLEEYKKAVRKGRRQWGDFPPKKLLQDVKVVMAEYRRDVIDNS